MLHGAERKTPPGEAIFQALLAWYDREHRRLPWRAPPGSRQDPYKVWLSEIMLQQTTVKAVAPRYVAFLRRWPTVQALAKTELGEVLAAWAGLGYYARARNLHVCAREIVTRYGGRFPESEATLRALPGIGAYTAAAIAAIAFGKKTAPVDGNIERVIARLFGVTEPLSKAKTTLRNLAESLVPASRSGDFAQSMMDLGAIICTPVRPACGRCPVSDHCLAYAEGLAPILPYREERTERPIRRGVAFVVIRKDGMVLLRERPPRGLLGGMLEVPSTPWNEKQPAASIIKDHAPVRAAWMRLPGLVRHSFTHFHLELEVWSGEVGSRAALTSAAQAERCRFVPIADLAGAALPTVMRKVLAHALGPNALAPKRQLRKEQAGRAPLRAKHRSA